MAQKGPFLENWLRSWDGGDILPLDGAHHQECSHPTPACLPLPTAPRPSWLCPAGGTGRGKATGCPGGLRFCIVSFVFVNGAKRRGHADCSCPVQAQWAGPTWLWSIPLPCVQKANTIVFSLHRVKCHLHPTEVQPSARALPPSPSGRGCQARQPVALAQ